MGTSYFNYAKHSEMDPSHFSSLIIVRPQRCKEVSPRQTSVKFSVEGYRQIHFSSADLISAGRRQQNDNLDSISRMAPAGHQTGFFL